jgi:hypothetical protein
MSHLLALLPAALCSRLLRRRTPPARSAHLPVMYANRPESPPQRVLTAQWRYQPVPDPPARVVPTAEGWQVIETRNGEPCSHLAGSILAAVQWAQRPRRTT